MSEIEVFHDESLTDSSDPPAAVQSTSAPQDNSTEPAAAIRGRRPSCTTAANASKCRSPPSPSPPRQQPPSPASSYTSVFSHAPSAENWTVAGLRQVLTSAGVIIPRRSSKADLLALYNSLQSGELQNSSPPLKSATTASKSRKSPYSRPGPIFTPSRTGLRPPKRSGRPSASLGRAPDAAALSPHLPRASTERQLATQPSEEPAFTSTSRLTRTSTPPSAANSYTQPRINEPLPYPWPAAPPLTASPTPSAQAPAPAFPPPPIFPPPLSVHQALSGSNLPQSLTQTPAIPPLFHAVRYLSTPVNIFRLSSELVHHPDPQFTKYLLPGLSHGFHPGVGNLPSESLICPNLQSALTEPETVDILIKKEIEANFMIGPFPVPRFNIFQRQPHRRSYQKIFR